MELDPLFVDVAVRRWQAFTGREATLQGGGSFELVASERLKSGSTGIVFISVGPANTSGHKGHRSFFRAIGGGAELTCAAGHQNQRI